jgi:hypothetical protein
MAIIFVETNRDATKAGCTGCLVVSYSHPYHVSFLSSSHLLWFQQHVVTSVPQIHQYSLSQSAFSLQT